MNDPYVETIEMYAAFDRAASLPAGFGDGWLSNAAQDMVRIGVFAGFDARELVRRVAFAGARNARRGTVTTNAATVERILGEMNDEQRNES